MFLFVEPNKGFLFIEEEYVPGESIRVYLERNLIYQNIYEIMAKGGSKRQLESQNLNIASYIQSAKGSSRHENYPKDMVLIPNSLLAKGGAKNSLNNQILNIYGQSISAVGSSRFMNLVKGIDVASYSVLAKGGSRNILNSNEIGISPFAVDARLIYNVLLQNQILNVLQEIQTAKGSSKKELNSLIAQIIQYSSSAKIEINVLLNDYLMGLLPYDISVTGSSRALLEKASVGFIPYDVLATGGSLAELSSSVVSIIPFVELVYLLEDRLIQIYGSPVSISLDEKSRIITDLISVSNVSQNSSTNRERLESIVRNLLVERSSVTLMVEKMKSLVTVSISEKSRVDEKTARISSKISSGVMAGSEVGMKNDLDSKIKETVTNESGANVVVGKKSRLRGN